MQSQSSIRALDKWPSGWASRYSESGQGSTVVDSVAVLSDSLWEWLYKKSGREGATAFQFSDSKRRFARHGYMTVSFTFAVECPAGSYYNKDSQTCQKCQEGTYQNSTGQMNCIPCPQGTWTVGIHARNYTECFGKARLANLGQHF